MHLGLMREEMRALETQLSDKRVAEEERKMLQLEQLNNLTFG